MIGLWRKSVAQCLARLTGVTNLTHSVVQGPHVNDQLVTDQQSDKRARRWRLPLSIETFKTRMKP